jgi:hypothetical protein
MTNEKTQSEKNLYIWLNEILEAAIAGDFTKVKVFAKKIRKQALEDRAKTHN